MKSLVPFFVAIFISLMPVSYTHLHSGIVFHKLHGLVDHKIFQPLFTDSLFLAALVLFGSSTFIIAVDFCLLYTSRCV